MTSKERVHRALQRKPVDRVPIFMWHHLQTSLRLGRLLEIPAEYVPIAMGDDIRQAWVSNNHAMEGIVHAHDGEFHVDDWGIEWTRVEGFNQISRYILAASHTIPPETSDENIFALYHEAGITKEEIFDNAANIRKSLRQSRTEEIDGHDTE